MKRKALLLVLLLSLLLSVAHAESADLADRVAALEAMLGVTPAQDATLEERVEALEEAHVSLDTLETFTRDHFLIKPKSENAYLDNYDNHYVVSLACDSHYNSGFAEYLLDGQYTRLTGILFVTKYAREHDFKSNKWETATFSVYGDDELLFTFSGFDPYMEAQPIDIDISSVKFLKLEFDRYKSGICLGEPMLWR